MTQTRPATQTIGTAAALLLAGMALYYVVQLTVILIQRSADGLTHGVVLVALLYFVVCPAMVGAALLNAWHFVQHYRNAEGASLPLPRLLRPGLWMIAAVWSLAFIGSLLRGRHGDAPEDLLVFALLYAGPAVLALICLVCLPSSGRPK